VRERLGIDNRNNFKHWERNTSQSLVNE